MDFGKFSLIFECYLYFETKINYLREKSLPCLQIILTKEQIMILGEKQCFL